MKKLDNRGFAITGILYTVLIMFLMILLNILGTLRASRAMMTRSIIGTEHLFAGKDVTDTKLENDKTVLETTEDTKKAPVTGKYIFELTYKTENENIEKKYECSSYLMKGTDLANKDEGEIKKIIYTPKDCNDYIYEFNFNISGDEVIVNTMKLKKIYKLGSDEDE